MELRLVLPDNKNEICRFCLNVNQSVTYPLFYEREPTKLHELASNLQLEIPYEDILPNNICYNCERQLQAISSFKLSIIDNEKILRCVYVQSIENELPKSDPSEITEPQTDGDTERKLDLESDQDQCTEFYEDPEVEEATTVKDDITKEESIEQPEKNNRSKLGSCEKCGKSFRKDYLKKHKTRCKGNVKIQENESSEQESTTYNCTVCNEHFETELRCSLHYIQHFLYEGKEKIDPIVFCNFCGFILQTYEEYLSHITEKHSDWCSKTWVCKLCSYGYSTEFELVAHMHTSEFCKTIQVDNADRNCLICKKEFDGPLSNHLKKHLLKRHGCLKCQDKFITLIAHNNHLVSHPEYKHKCNHCSRMFVLKSNMEKHIKEMHEDEKYICEICSKFFNRKNNLLSHIRQKHDNQSMKIICPLCGYSTVSKHDLKRHERFHTNEKPFKCNFDACNKAYKTSSALSHHKKTHLNIRNYNCELCDKSFYTSNHLKDHMYIHTGERNFGCNICGNAFKRKDQLSAHLKIHKPRSIEIQIETKPINTEHSYVIKF